MKTRRSEFVRVPESGGEFFAESEAHQWPNLTYGVFTGEFCAKSLIEVVRVSRSRLPRGSGNTIGVVTPEICVTGDETTFCVIAEEPCPSHQKSADLLRWCRHFPKLYFRSYWKMGIIIVFVDLKSLNVTAFPGKIVVNSVRSIYSVRLPLKYRCDGR